MQKISKGISSRIWVRLQHGLLEAIAQVKGLVATANLDDESPQSKRTFYLISLMLFVSLVLVAPDKIPQTFATSQVNPAVFDRIQEIVKKAVPFIG